MLNWEKRYKKSFKSLWIQMQSFRCVIIKRCSDNMQKIYKTASYKRAISIKLGFHYGLTWDTWDKLCALIFLAHGLIFTEYMFLKSEIWVTVVCKKYINMDKEFFDGNLLLLLFQLLKFRKLRKSKCKKIYIFLVNHQSFGYKISLITIFSKI